MQITTKIMNITPQMAIEWLDKNDHNRKISQIVVDKYARDMKAGQWLLTNQGIGFDENGRLLDGQHRLKAIVKSGCMIQSLVIFGLKNKMENGVFTQDVIDTLKPRTVADVLSLSHNVGNASLKTAIANMLISIIKNTTKISMSASQVYKVIDLYSDEIDMILIDRTAVKGFSSAPMLAGMVFAAKVEPDLSMGFKEKYFKGTALFEGSPILTLRQYVIRRVEKGSTNVVQGAVYRKMAFDYTTLAIYNHIKGIHMKQLKVSDKGTRYFMDRQKGCVSRILSMFNGMDVRDQARDGYIKR